METLKEIDTQESLKNSYEFVSLEGVEFYELELPSSPEENSSSYTAIELPLDPAPEQTVELNRISLKIPKSESFLQTFKEDLTIFFHVTKVETQETLPFIEIKKEQIE